ncbi:EAL domain-containing protein [Sphingomonas paeninsulae]|uniref:EAL domain-containing protein n=1 Tax=Sphingomonas paeninsulae TaxID=2319844 RepID=UPI0013CE50D6|nr:EAL domain-containing protein [Sphingomonas paeninsulae]
MAASAIATFCGAIELGEPLEDILKGARDVVRSQPASGNIIVIGVDDKTATELGGVSFSRTVDAQLVDRLFAAGVKSVYFDRAYSDPTTVAADTAFATALAKHRGRVYLGAMTQVSGQNSGLLSTILPIPQFRKAADYRSLNGFRTPFALSAKLTFSDTFEGRDVPSISTAMAVLPTSRTGFYRPDWSIQANTVPTYSFVDIVKGRIDKRLLAGRTVVVGPTAPRLNDYQQLVFQGWIPGAFFHVIGAETLLRGTPVNYGWIPAILVVIGLGCVYLWASARRVRTTAVIIALAALVALPAFLDAALITVDVLPALLLFLIVAYRGLMLRRIEASERTNPLTGLLNIHALRNGTVFRDATLVAIKLRNQSEIAASFDESVGDRIIQEVCRRLTIGQTETEIYHGDDTLLWMTSLPMGLELAHHIEGLHQLSKRSITLDGRDVDLSLAFGIDADFERPMTSRIGSAMLCAEEASQANDIWKLYDPHRQDEAAWALSLMSRLDHAIDTQELWVAFQPKASAASGEIIGAEALVRWQHPTRGLISPDQFIPVAEEANRIDRLTEFVLDRAVEGAASITALGHSFSIAVNLSTQMLLRPDLSEMIDTILARHQFPHASLTLEITETGQLVSSPLKLAMMKKLSQRGIQVSIDDYGTGNATLEYLKLLPSNEVKIDRRFVFNIVNDQLDRILVESTIDVAHNLGRTVVAEGVESEAVRAALVGMGCDVIQGFLVGKPVDLETLKRRVGIGRGQLRTG